MAEVNPKMQALAGDMVAAVRSMIDRALAPINTRLANAEFKLGALGLHLGRENPQALVELESLLARVNALETRVAELPGDGSTEGGLTNAARALKPRLKYSGGSWVRIDGFHERPDAR